VRSQCVTQADDGERSDTTLKDVATEHNLSNLIVPARLDRNYSLAACRPARVAMVKGPVE